MITLNRLGHRDEPFQLNPDMIVTVESTPDTVLALATGAKVVVSETPEEVAAAVRAYRSGVLSEALRNRRAPSAPGAPASHRDGSPAGHRDGPVPGHRDEFPAGTRDVLRLAAVEDDPE